MAKTPSFFERLTGGGSTGDDAVSDEATEVAVESPEEEPTQIDANTEAPAEAEKSARDTKQKSSQGDKDEWMEEAQEGQLTIDVYQTDTDIIIKSTVAGVSPEDLDIAITNDMITIRGRRDRDEEVREDQYFYQECYWGPFSRSVILPADVAADKVEATMRHGILTVRLPKIEKEQTKKIKVKALT